MRVYLVKRVGKPLAPVNRFANTIKVGGRTFLTQHLFYKKEDARLYLDEWFTKDDEVWEIVSATVEHNRSWLSRCLMWLKNKV